VRTFLAISGFHYDFDVFLRSENGGRSFSNDRMIARNQNATMMVGNDFILDEQW
jgi:hypothetical protein